MDRDKPEPSVDDHSDTPDFSSAPDQGGSIADAALADVVTWATAAAWAELIAVRGRPDDPLPIWCMLAKHVLAAADRGERDPVRLKAIALQQLSKEGQ